MASLRALDKWKNHPMFRQTLWDNLPGFRPAAAAFVGYVAYDKAMGMSNRPNAHGGHHHDEHHDDHHTPPVSIGAPTTTASSRQESEVFEGDGGVKYQYIKMKNGEVELRELD